MIDRSGEVIRDYEFHEPLGEGSFATVYRATELGVNRNVAIKVIHPKFLSDDETMQRFKIEAEIVANLEHPFIVSLYKFWVDNEGAYIVMQMMSMGSLADLLEREGKLTPDVVMRLLSQVAPALSLVHRKKIIHRDLKPANILLDSNHNAHLADFGLAKWEHQSTYKTQEGSTVGTAMYLAPEQIEASDDSPISGKADIYALGIILFELLTGQHPFGGRDTPMLEMLMHHHRDSLPSLRTIDSELSSDIQDVLEIATAKDPDDRYEDVLILAQAFQEAILEPQIPNFVRPTAPLDVPSVSPGELSARQYLQAGAVLENPRKLIGRDNLVERIVRWLGESERVLLHGLGGIGKTVLAGTVAAAYLKTQGRTVIWLELGRQDLDTLFATIARALGRYPEIASKQGVDRIPAMREILLAEDERDILLVVDNIWNESSVLPFLQAVPNDIPVLLTSRSTISIDGYIVDVKVLSPDDALALLEHHARRQYQNHETAKQLCKLLGYHPYAIEFAGKRLNARPYLNPHKLIKAITSTNDRSLDTGILVDEEQHSPEEIIDESVKDLPEKLQELLVQIGGMYATHASVDLMAHVAQIESDEMEKLLVLLDRNGLLRLVATDELPLHYHLHDLAYSLSHKMFKSKGYDHQHMIRAVRAFLAENIAGNNGRDRTNYDALEFEILNILGVARAAHNEGDNEGLIDIIQHLVVKANYLTARGPSSAALELLEAAIEIAKRGDNYEAAHYFTAKLGNVYFQITAQYELAVETYTASMNLAKKIGNLSRQASLTSFVATARFRAGMDKVEWYYEQASRIAQESGDVNVVAQILSHRSFHAILITPPDYEASRKYSNVAIQLSYDHDIRNEVLLSALNNRSVCEKKLGLIKDALQTDLKAYHVAEEINDQMWIARLTDNIGRDYHSLGNRKRAAEYLRKALALANQLGYEELASNIRAFAKEHHYELET